MTTRATLQQQIDALQNSIEFVRNPPDDKKLFSGTTSTPEEDAAYIAQLEAQQRQLRQQLRSLSPLSRQQRRNLYIGIGVGIGLLVVAAVIIASVVSSRRRAATLQNTQ